MRVAFLVLVLANLALYAWLRYGVPPEPASPVSRQMAPERLRVVEPSSFAAAQPSKPAGADPAAACLEWGGFTAADAARAEQALEPLGLGGRVAQRRTDDAAGYWVFMPSQGSRQAALRKAAELKQLGVNDYFIVQDEGELRWALSLGVFRTQEAAQARLAELRGQGVRTAQVGARDAVVPKLWLQIKGVDAPLQARLREVARQIEGSELRECS